jgi:hypothetical protein
MRGLRPNKSITTKSVRINLKSPSQVALLMRVCLVTVSIYVIITNLVRIRVIRLD